MDKYKIQCYLLFSIKKNKLQKGPKLSDNIICVNLSSVSRKKKQRI